MNLTDNNNKMKWQLCTMATAETTTTAWNTQKKRFFSVALLEQSLNIIYFHFSFKFFKTIWHKYICARIDQYYQIAEPTPPPEILYTKWKWKKIAVFRQKKLVQIFWQERQLFIYLYLSVSAKRLYRICCCCYSFALILIDFRISCVCWVYWRIGFCCFWHIAAKRQGKRTNYIALNAVCDK